MPIIEALYTEALVLADEVRAVFDLSPVEGNGETDAMRIALSIEGLRTTTRVMHILAWLLNQRALIAGEISDFQVRRQGALPADRESDPVYFDALLPPTQELIAATRSMHARIARLDKSWREGFKPHSSAVLRLRERLQERIGPAAGSA